MEVEEIELKQVKSFKYLEIQIQSIGKQETETNERISTAIKTYCTLNKDFLKRRGITEKNQSKKVIFYSIFAYGNESWMVTKDMRSNIQAAEPKYLRRMKGITKRDRVRNEVVRQKLIVEPILKTLHKQQLKWFGHLMRMINSRLVKRYGRPR